jgi:hypothetical protein
MKRQKSCGPRLGKLVHQLPGVVTFAYDLRFRRVIACWKGIIEEIHFGGSIMPLDIIENLDLKKPSFRPSKWPRKLKPAKNSKLPKLPENCFEPVGKGGWPPISTWITGVVTFAYDLCFRCVIACWKGIIEEIHFGGSIMPSDIIENLDLKKPSFRPLKWPRKLKPAKNSKLPKFQKTVLSQLEKVGGHRYPPGSPKPMTRVDINDNSQSSNNLPICH